MNTAERNSPLVVPPFGGGTRNDHGVTMLARRVPGESFVAPGNTVAPGGVNTVPARGTACAPETKKNVSVSTSPKTHVRAANLFIIFQPPSRALPSEWG